MQTDLEARVRNLEQQFAELMNALFAIQQQQASTGQAITLATQGGGS